MSQPEIDYLRHILEEAEFLARLGRGVDRSRFEMDGTLKRATVRSIEVIGEATKHLSNDFRAKYPNVPWRLMAGMRDRLIHGYISVDYDIVWDVVQNEAPKLQVDVERILDVEEPD